MGTRQSLYFSVPAECSPQDKVFIVFSSKTDLNEYSTEPDSFFLNRIVDYFCDCKAGHRGYGCCTHVAAALLGARLTTEEKAKLKYKRQRDILTNDNYGRFNDPEDLDPKEEKTAEPKSSISHAEKVKSNEPSQASNPILEESEKNDEDYHHIWDVQDGDLNLNDKRDINDYSEVIQDFENEMNMMEDHDNSSAVPAVHQLE